MLYDVSVYLAPEGRMITINDLPKTDLCMADIIKNALSKAIYEEKRFDIDEIVKNPWVSLQVSYYEEEKWNQRRERIHAYFVTKIYLWEDSIRSDGIITWPVPPVGFTLVKNETLDFGAYRRNS